jgi:hypothetical protein
MTEKPAEHHSVETKKQRIEANWRLEPLDEVPFIIEVGPLHVATADFFADHQAELAWNEDFHRKRERVYDYAFPNSKPNKGINIVAAAFGCPCTVNNQADPWVTPLIREENIQDVYKLEIPDPADNPVFAAAWERVEFLQNRSAMPLRLVNVPSPLVSASLIWEYTSFIEATVMYPEEVHALMEKVTCATIGYIKEQLKRITNRYTMGHELWYIPRDAGVRISDDTAALLSPALYREFGVKYNAMIAEAVGGVVVHSCGDVSHVAPVMMEIPGLRGLDFTIPQVSRWDAVRDAAAGKTALCLRHCYWDHGHGAKVDLAAYSKQLVDFFGPKGLFIHTSTPAAEEAEALGNALRRLLSR